MAVVLMFLSCSQTPKTDNEFVISALSKSISAPGKWQTILSKRIPVLSK